MQTRLFFLLAPLLAVVGLLAPADASASASAPAATGAVGGIVTHGGAPVHGAHVVLQVSRGGVVTQMETVSDARGRYLFRGVPAGHGVVRAEHRRAGRDAERFVLRPGAALRVHLRLH